MAHPYANVRQSKVERSRVASLLSGSVAGGGPKTIGKPVTHKIAKTPNAGSMKMDGGKSKVRLDRYARGGKVKKGATNVNVIIAPQGGGAGAAPPPAVSLPPASAGPPMPPPAPPMMPPGGPAMAKSGGRMYASGGAVSDGAAWKEGIRNGTQPQNSPGKNDTSDILRPKQITYAKGGMVQAPMGPKFDGGAQGGIGRLQKTRLQKKSYP